MKSSSLRAIRVAVAIVVKAVCLGLIARFVGVTEALAVGTLDAFVLGSIAAWKGR